MPDDETILIGRVARAHGIRGQVIANSHTDFPEQRFREGAEILVVQDGAVTRRTIATVRFQQDRPVIGFVGIATMNDAERLAGAELRIPASELGPLPEGAFHHHQLIGCEVRDLHDDVLIGRVRAIEGPMERSRLVVDAERGEVQIPLTDGICVSIDPAAGRIVVDLPEGLIELNFPARPR